MTRTVRKTICALVIGIFLLVSLCALAWATDGFVNWKASSWFNYWGKGSPTVVVENNTAGTPEASVYVGARNVGVVHDSDDGVMTTAVYKCSNPTAVLGSSGLDVYTNGQYWRTNLDMNIYSGTGSLLKHELYTYTTTSNGVPKKSNVFTITFADMKTLGLHNGDLFNVVLKNIGSGSYTDSDEVTRKFMYFDDLQYTFAEARITFSEVSIPSGYNIQYRFAATNHIVTNGSTYADVYGMTASTSGNYTTFSGNYNNQILSSGSNAEFSYNATKHAYEIDLTKCSFVETLCDNCAVYTWLYITDSNSSVITAFLNMPVFHFAISKLATPTNIRVEDCALKWDTVEGACGYGVYMDDNNLGIVTEAELDLNDIEFESGTHTFRVRALGNVSNTLMASRTMTAFNASNHITQLVALSFNVDGEVITKLVEGGKALSTYLYDVQVEGKVFGGWYYDDGYSVPVYGSDKLDKDVTIYARLSDVQVTERQLTWWELHKWQVLIPCFVVGGLIVLAAVAVTVKKKKQH